MSSNGSKPNIFREKIDERGVFHRNSRKRALERHAITSTEQSHHKSLFFSTILAEKSATVRHRALADHSGVSSFIRHSTKRHGHSERMKQRTEANNPKLARLHELVAPEECNHFNDAFFNRVGGITSVVMCASADELTRQNFIKFGQ